MHIYGTAVCPSFTMRIFVSPYALGYTSYGIADCPSYERSLLPFSLPSVPRVGKPPVSAGGRLRMTVDY
jgi:hypothetical protein